MERKIKQPTLFLRSGYFIDNLKASTGLGFEKIEKQIRDNQYENPENSPDLIAPSFDTVRDYFRLHRSVAFEPDQEARIAPWLLAAELEFPSSSFAFFHPIFDLLFGELESSAFWSAHFRKIPHQWIDDLTRRGESELAKEWGLMNEAIDKRTYRKKQKDTTDQLTLIHLSLLRLPDEIRKTLFAGNGSSPNWTRRYSSVDSEIHSLSSYQNMEGMTALLGLMMEAAEIGDHNRFKLLKPELIPHMSFMDDDPSCVRIKDLLKQLIIGKYRDLFPREYNGYLHHGFGMPVSWRVRKLAELMQTIHPDYSK